MGPKGRKVLAKAATEEAGCSDRDTSDGQRSIVLRRRSAGEVVSTWRQIVDVPVACRNSWFRRSVGAKAAAHRIGMALHLWRRSA